MMKKALLFLAFLSSPALADGPGFKSVSCGDHWFEITAVLDPGGLTAVVSFNGDGVSDHSEHAATVVDSGDWVIALDGTAQALIVDDFDAMHDIYWGSWKDGDSVTSLGLCQVEPN